MNGGSVPAASPAATSSAADCGVAVFFGVRPVAVAVLEVDPEVLDRLARSLSTTRARIVSPASRGAQAERAARTIGVGRMLVERRQRERAELRRRVAPEQMRAAVDGVHRLPVAALAGIVARDRAIRARSVETDRREIALGEGRRRRLRRRVRRHVLTAQGSRYEPRYVE